MNKYMLGFLVSMVVGQQIMVAERVAFTDLLVGDYEDGINLSKNEKLEVTSVPAGHVLALTANGKPVTGASVGSNYKFMTSSLQKDKYACVLQAYGDGVSATVTFPLIVE